MNPRPKKVEKSGRLEPWFLLYPYTEKQAKGYPPRPNQFLKNSNKLWSGRKQLH